MIPASTCADLLAARTTVFQVERRDFIPGQAQPPSVVPTARLLLIERGGADYHVDGSQLALAAGQVLLVPALARRWWRAGPGAPFTMSWVEFLPTAREPLDLPCVHLAPTRGEWRACLELHRLIGEAGAQRDQRGRLRQEAELRALLARLLLHPQAQMIAAAQADGPGDGAVRAALAWLERHYAAPTPERDLARRFGLSDNHFRLRFRASVGTSPRAFVLELRLHAARQLLGAGTLGIKQVAASVGYRDPLLFSRLYRRRWGVPPSRDA